MWCRCNMCMEEFPEEEIYDDSEYGRSCLKCLRHMQGCPGEDPDGCEDYFPIEACPRCGERGCIMDLGEYAFEMFNGNAGRVEHFMTEAEAIEAAEIKWSHLTPRERVAYTDRSRGGLFQVYDDDGHVYRDWKDEADADDLVYIYRWKAGKVRR